MQQVSGQQRTSMRAAYHGSYQEPRANTSGRQTRLDRPLHGFFMGVSLGTLPEPIAAEIPMSLGVAHSMASVSASCATYTSEELSRKEIG